MVQWLLLGEIMKTNAVYAIGMAADYLTDKYSYFSLKNHNVIFEKKQNGFTGN